MKTREEIYEKEGATLLRTISTYHTLTYEQVIRTFNRKPETIRNLISSLVKQGRIFYDRDSNLICDRANRVIHRITPSSPLIGYSWILIKHWSITQAENFRLQSPFFLKMKSMKSFTSSLDRNY